MIPHIKTNNYVTAICDGTHKFSNEHENFEILMKAIYDGDTEQFLESINIISPCMKVSERFTERDGVLYFENEQVPEAIHQYLNDLNERDEPTTHIENFIRLLFANPSRRAVQELFSWMQHKGIVIKEDGMVLGYKGVIRVPLEHIGKKDKMGRLLQDEDLVDVWTKRNFRNNVGDVNYMSRNTVDDDFGINCSEGLHIGTESFARGYGDTMTLVEFSPADVVSVPADSNCQKIRVCKYEVISIL